MFWIMNALILYRIYHWLELKRIPFIPGLLFRINIFVFHCVLPPRAVIGKGVVLGYGGLGIVVHERCIIGDGCTISQNVTLGGRSKQYGVPVLGKNVLIGAGAVILGPVSIGDDAKIGANAVVLTDVNKKNTAVGVPAKIIRPVNEK